MKTEDSAETQPVNAFSGLSEEDMKSVLSSLRPTTNIFLTFVVGKRSALKNDGRIANLILDAISKGLKEEKK